MSIVALFNNQKVQATQVHRKRTDKQNASVHSVDYYSAHEKEGDGDTRYYDMGVPGGHDVTVNRVPVTEGHTAWLHYRRRLTNQVGANESRVVDCPAEAGGGVV